MDGGHFASPPRPGYLISKKPRLVRFKYIHLLYICSELSLVGLYCFNFSVFFNIFLRFSVVAVIAFVLFVVVSILFKEFDF